MIYNIKDQNNNFIIISNQGCWGLELSLWTTTFSVDQFQSQSRIDSCVQNNCLKMWKLIMNIFISFIINLVIIFIPTCKTFPSIIVYYLFFACNHSLCKSSSKSDREYIRFMIPCVTWHDISCILVRFCVLPCPSVWTDEIFSYIRRKLWTKNHFLYKVLYTRNTKCCFHESSYDNDKIQIQKWA